MSDYMVKMGAKPETFEDYAHKTMGDMMRVITLLMKGERPEAQWWMEEILLPNFDKLSKLQDPKYGTHSTVLLHRKGDFDWDLISSHPSRPEGMAPWSAPY